MLYVASAQPATAQLDAFACDFLVPDERCLIINKLTRLQVWSVHGQKEDDEAGEERVQMELEIPIWGTIAAVSSVKVPGQSTSSLIVLTTCLHLFALCYSPTAPHVITSSTTSILEPYGRLSSYQTIQIDPLLRCLIIHTYNGLIHVIPLTPAKRRGSKSAATKGEIEAVELDLTRGYNVRLQSLNVTSIAFLPSESTESPPSIAMLFSDHLGRRVLESHVIDLDEKELSLGPIAETVMDDPGSEIVVPVAGTDAGHAGVVVVGEQTVVFVAARAEDKGKGTGTVEDVSVKAALPVGMIQAWTKVDGAEDKYLLGDIYGKLILLDVIRGASGRVVGLTVTDLGDTSSPTSIVYLGPALLYLSSRFADSQLVRLPRNLISGEPEAMDTAEDADGGLQLITSFASLSPILDCCVVPAEGGGASHVVTCSGAYKGGSLRVVRQGVGLSELASLEMENVQRIFALKRDASTAEILVLSSFNETTVLSFASAEDAEDEIEEIEIPAFAADTATLLVCHVGSLYIQVTTKGISYSAGIDGTVGSWSQAEGKKVTLGATDGEHLVLAVEGGLLIVLKVEGETLSQIGSHQFENEIACIDIATVASRIVAAVGLWTVQTVLIIAIPTLEILSTQVIESDYLIRSVLITTFADGVTQLFAGLGDGALTSFIVDAPQAKIVAETSKTVTLGTRPIVMCGFEANGVVSIFVSSDRPTVISRTSDKLVYSSVNLKNINAVVAFNSATYPASLALASPTELRIGRIDDISAVDIRAIPLEEDEPRRIAHDPVSHTYGVVCLRRDIDRVTGDQVTQGSVKIFDDQSFEVLADIALDPMEECQSIISLPVGDSRKYIVGTAFVLPTESEPTKGRLLLFSETASRSYELTAQINVDGCAYALASLTDNHVAAAVNSQVEVFSIDATTLSLTRVASWGGAFISLSLISCPDNTLLVGDALRSITLLKFHVSPPKIEEVSRDYNTRYMAAIESLGGSADFIGAETDLNLFTVQKENVTNARSMDDEYALAPRGVFHLGEMISKFQHGSLVQQYGENAGIASPRLIFSTSAGSLGVIVELDAASSKILSDLERNMRRCIPGVGGIKQEDWRSFKSERSLAPSAGFVDGNFVELFLELSAEDIAAVLEGGSENEKIQVSKDALSALVEELARLH